MNGYPPIEDHGLIGDGYGCALVGCDGAIDWMCVPSVDNPPLLRGLLDHVDGGEFLLAPEHVRESRQYYLPDTGVLVTELRCSTGLVEVTDAFTLRAGADLTEDAPAARGELLRYVRVLEGSARLRLSVRLCGGSDADRYGGGLRLRPHGSGSELHLLASRPLDALQTTVAVTAAEDLWLLLRWEPHTHRVHHVHPRRLLEQTAATWRRWSAGISYDGPRAELVRRCALTLKLLGNRGVVTAAGSSHSEPAQHGRHQRHRYSQIRDAAHFGFALRRIGLPSEAASVLGRALDAAEEAGPVPHDASGEVLDCAFQWASHGGLIDDALWSCLLALAQTADAMWGASPDRDTWQVRTSRRRSTHSVAMDQVALDRAARLATRLNLPGDTTRWSTKAAALADRIVHEAWDEGQQSLTSRLGPGGEVDARLLALPLRRVVPADHPRMVATTRAITDRQSAGDGPVFPLIHSFWLVDNLLGQGRTDDAGELYESLCARANPLGLLPELIDPVDGSFLGNFPHALSHVGVISSGAALTRALHGRRPELFTQT